MSRQQRIKSMQRDARRFAELARQNGPASAYTDRAAAIAAALARQAAELRHQTKAVAR